MDLSKDNRRHLKGGVATMEPLAVPIPEAQRISGMSRTGIYRELGEGRLRAVKMGARTLVLVESLRAYVASLPAAEFGPSRTV